ncbi:hypothetical protein [Collimonas fungivorans]|jgi:hypothetical protein|uniref:hypothetical protein n=1 Tax=Collimonas fungivorans TaxID=158899 RepID=UPI003FA36040
MASVKQTDRPPIEKPPLPPTNGGIPQQSPEELAVATAVQHHVASYQRVVAERDELQRQLDRMEQSMTVSKIEIEALRAERGAAVSRMESYQRERDDAVANLTVYQTMYISMMAQLRAFGIEHAPLIKEQPDPTP